MGRKNKTTANDSLLTPLVSELSLAVVSPRRGNDATTKRQFGTRRSKYGSKRVTRSSGEKFDSRGESRWYAGLEWLERSGKISALRRQVTIPLWVGDEPLRSIGSSRVLAVKPDAMFVENGKTVVADYKGAPITRESLFKFSVLQAMHPDWIIRLEGPGAPKPRAARKPRALRKAAAKAKGRGV